MKIFVAGDGRIYVESCTECGAPMTVLNECLPADDVLVFRCDNPECGKILSFPNPKEEVPIEALTAITGHGGLK